uniref:Peptidase S1 domain-containing protein n=1 Tax=Chromera velia CCMP2878 TaxID=1169474 RepID=A0A0G4FMD1_9ALVE|eukprot:Cvel_17756.t1-p1 / transcript=Cvel_17756.t1 / gene=Cvel_17756 / organism=Chromera_velia_CCMP2878 / gene_product=hypothetical protein / transcript_product=hypothetical protein / location=Cvel_scaffold1435:6504-7508(-) / protein_length=335 / sequence_SO=supercontig / SO=protein_coding / is_pseudo=false
MAKRGREGANGLVDPKASEAASSVSVLTDLVRKCVELCPSPEAHSKDPKDKRVCSAVHDWILRNHSLNELRSVLAHLIGPDRESQIYLQHEDKWVFCARASKTAAAQWLRSSVISPLIFLLKSLRRTRTLTGGQKVSEIRHLFAEGIAARPLKFVERRQFWRAPADTDIYDWVKGLAEGPILGATCHFAQAGGGTGVHVGNGIILTAAHVVENDDDDEEEDEDSDSDSDSESSSESSSDSESERKPKNEKCVEKKKKEPEPRERVVPKREGRRKLVVFPPDGSVYLAVCVFADDDADIAALQIQAQLTEAPPVSPLFPESGLFLPPAATVATAAP